MTRWYEVRGIEPGGKSPPALLYKVPAAQLSAAEREEWLEELRRQGVTELSAEEVEC